MTQDQSLSGEEIKDISTALESRLDEVEQTIDTGKDSRGYRHGQYGRTELLREQRRLESLLERLGGLASQTRRFGR